MQEYFVKSYYPKFIENSNNILSYYDTEANIMRVLPNSAINGRLFDMTKNLSVEKATEVLVLKSTIIDYEETKNIITVNGKIKIDGKFYLFMQQFIVQIKPNIQIFVDTLNVLDIDQFLAQTPVFKCAKMVKEVKRETFEKKEYPKKNQNRSPRDYQKKRYDNHYKGPKQNTNDKSTPSK